MFSQVGLRKQRLGPRRKQSETETGVENGGEAGGEARLGELEQIIHAPMLRRSQARKCVCAVSRCTDHASRWSLLDYASQPRAARQPAKETPRETAQTDR
eukprot:3405192-Rhodomonas_salina.3